MFLQTIDGITKIVAEKDKSVEDPPPVLLHQLVKLRGRDFTLIVTRQLDRLKCS